MNYRVQLENRRHLIFSLASPQTPENGVLFYECFLRKITSWLQQDAACIDAYSVEVCNVQLRRAANQDAPFFPLAKTHKQV